MSGDWGLYVSKFTKDLMIWIEVLWMTFSNLKINRREVSDKYKLNLDIPKWNQRVRKFKFISEISFHLSNCS